MMLQTVDPAPVVDRAGEPIASPAPAAAYAPVLSDGGYRAGGNRRGRIFGLSLTIALHIVAAGLLLIRWHSEYVKQQHAALNVFDVALPAPPAETVSPQPPPPDVPPPQARPVDQPRPEIPKIQIPTPLVNPVPPVRPAPPTPPVDRPPPPEVRPAAAPPPPPPPGTGKPTWEGQVLAALNKVRRYPREALFRRQQGVPYIRFVMDRDGKVLSARLERSSGVSSLDTEAVALAKRAQPLPKPPESVQGDTIELVVPVEFFLK